MQHLKHRVLALSAAGAVSFYMLRNRNKKSTVFATQVSEDDIRTTRSQRQSGSQKPDSITDRVTFSLIENTTNEPFENGLELLNVQVFFRHGARTPLKNLPGLKEVTLDRYNVNVDEGLWLCKLYREVAAHNNPVPALTVTIALLFFF